MLSSTTSSTAILEPPVSIDDTDIVTSKLVEYGLGQVKVTVTTSRTLIHNLGIHLFAVNFEGDPLEAIGTRISTTVLGRVQGYDHVRFMVHLTTSALSNGIKGEATVVTLSFV